MTAPEVNWVWRCQIRRIVDGDTLYVLVDNGFRNREWHAIRLADVDTPELFRGDDAERQAGAEARDEVERWVAEKATTGDEFGFTLRTDKDRQSFNRYIGWIWAPDGDSLNDHLIGLGYGSER